MTATNAGNKYKFAAIQARRSNIQEVQLCKVKKNGEPGAARGYQMLGAEQTAKDVITRLMKNNPGNTWIEA